MTPGPQATAVRDIPSVGLRQAGELPDLVPLLCGPLQPPPTCPCPSASPHLVAGRTTPPTPPPPWQEVEEGEKPPASTASSSFHPPKFCLTQDS